MTGDRFSAGAETYVFIERLSEGRHADVYMCENESGGQFVAKYFCKGRPKSVNGWGKKNHYGRRRDGSHPVFMEIFVKSREYDFLVRYFHRIRFKGCWLVLMDFMEGKTLQDFFTGHPDEQSAQPGRSVSL